MRCRSLSLPSWDTDCVSSSSCCILSCPEPRLHKGGEHGVSFPVTTTQWERKSVNDGATWGKESGLVTGKYHQKVRSSPTLGKRINSLSCWKVNLSGDGIQVRSWASPRSGGLLDANKMWVWRSDVDPERPGRECQEVSFSPKMPRHSASEVTREGESNKNALQEDS